MKGVCLIFGVLVILGSVRCELTTGFYSHSCPKAEKIIQDYVNQHILKVPSLAAALIRMHFHDCFVRGCDASLLLNVTPTSGNQTEKGAIPNQTILGFDFIDKLKSLVEAECPGVVSCADIITLAARDSIVVIGGPSWKVPTGRRDGLISIAFDTFTQIPAPFDNITILQQKLVNKGLDLKDLVVLSGVHTIGVAHCSSFSNRLYNFSGRGDQDPTLDGEYANNLRSRKCTTPNDSTTLVEMDPGSSKTFDRSYYTLLLKRRGLFQSDSALTKNATTLKYINKILKGSLKKFYKQFALSMQKMGRIDVKTGSAGEIRRNCAFVNS
ncbi:heme peroxidase [Artemisia annua]|uniref:Peroxidase n=1 Tax=Artemisia annua TaxID=35608 RepID=A0A2U1LKA9_ARTAN|nr:heme peroxidase [Artemisia annua]